MKSATEELHNRVSYGFLKLHEFSVFELPKWMNQYVKFKKKCLMIMFTK